MALTPIKSAKSLLFSPRKLSPISSKFLSPRQVVNTPEKKIQTTDFNSCQNAIANCSKNYLLQVPPCNIEFENLEKVLINTPNKASLLRYGASKSHLLNSLLGKGSFGTVIKGLYKENVVAVKIIKVSESINEKNALHLSHENIVKTVDVIVKSPEKYALILMEFHKNSKNLQSVIDDINFEITRAEVVKFSKDIINGIKFCHENKILHLDIKPRNVLLCENICKICDFGNSMKETEVLNYTNYIGTVAYTAPEILRGKNPSTKSDIYSFGILLWQLISRQTPYNMLNRDVIIYKVVKFRLRPSQDFAMSIKFDDILKLCNFCWEEEPLNRPSADEVYTILNSLLCA